MSDNTIPFPDEFLLNVYRDRTLAMLRRYARCAIELGRLPSLLGREFFRARVTSYTVHTFEDAIIFAFDMESCLAALTHIERILLARIVIQEYSEWETARLMHCSLRTVERLYPDALDHLTEIMLERGMLAPSILEPRYARRKYAVVDDATEPDVTDAAVVPIGTISVQACQEAKNGVFAASA